MTRPRCLDVGEMLGGRRVFGLWANLYSARGERDDGMGTLSDLRTLVEWAGEAGADFVGVNPLHALRIEGGSGSPYSPTSRLFRHPLYLDLHAVPELADAPEARRRLEADRADARERAAADRIDAERVWRGRRPVLEALHRAFAANGAPERRRGFERWRAARGPGLEDFARFCALEDQLAAAGHPRDPAAWPSDCAGPDAPGVARFAAAHPEAVSFHAWLQFELDRQLAAVAEAARRAGLAVGLYTDLALGSSPSGFDAWAHPDAFADGFNAGAPPDAYAADGQDWGFRPLDPEGAVASGYWDALLAGAFEHAGALRIDHVMGLFRLWWVPLGRPAREGSYVRYPADALLDALARASRRAGALVVGEDLGTVPAGLPARLAARGILSSRVLLFERDRRGSFKPAARWSARALATANTHDLPTLAAWWRGADLALRHRLGELGDAELRDERAARDRDRRSLGRRLAREGLLSAAAPPGDFDALCPAVHGFLARTPAPLVGISLDDLAGEVEPVNVPGVGADRYPSWTRRMARPLAELRADPRVTARLAAGARPATSEPSP